MPDLAPRIIHLYPLVIGAVAVAITLIVLLAHRWKHRRDDAVFDDQRGTPDGPQTPSSRDEG